MTGHRVAGDLSESFFDTKTDRLTLALPTSLLNRGCTLQMRSRVRADVCFPRYEYKHWTCKTATTAHSNAMKVR